MIWLISVMPSIAPLVSAWMASILRLISSVALAVSLASSFTSLATTAKPFPASPARAASMAAFRASRFVCPREVFDHLEDLAVLLRPLTQRERTRRDGLDLLLHVTHRVAGLLGCLRDSMRLVRDHAGCRRQFLDRGGRLRDGR